ncbi:MAG: hypothetical protein AAFR31_13295 [Cyanobacteria bacterium J06627_8]
MASKNRRIYLPSKARGSKPKIPDELKAEVQRKFDHLIETEYRPKYIKPPSEKSSLGYLVDVFSQWYRSYFYICGTHHYPELDADSSSLDVKYSRFEYAGGDRFNIAYLRHTGQWWQIRKNVPLDDCLEEAKNNQVLHPY